MILPRLIALATTLVFLTVWCGPAFAGVRALVATTDGGGCCCSKEETTKHQTVQDIPCRCASCACSLEDAQPFAPLAATATVATVVAIAVESPVLERPTSPSHEPSSAIGARGPPPTESPPLYLLHDSWLI